MSAAGRRLIASILCCGLLAAACGDDSGSSGEAVPATTGAPSDSTTAAGLDGLSGGGIDPTLVRDDVDCTPEGLGEDEATLFTSAYYVVDGDLGAVCFGEEDPVLVEAWETLATITPGGQLRDLALFGAFESAEEGEEVTLAFVNTLDDDGSIFQMSVNAQAVQEDPADARITMVHEFSHVFTALSTQIDRFADPESCTTYDNGEGCYFDDSLMADWIATFWGDGLIDEVDPFEEATADLGQDRCDVNPAFFGAYAASNPEEDFAESFGAYVLQLPVDSPEQKAKYDWFDAQPGLVEFKDRAVAAGLGPDENGFDLCGVAA